MILNALYDLYKRLRDDPDISIDMPGLSKAKVAFELVLSSDGALYGVTDLRVQQGKKLQPVEMMVPFQVKRTSGDCAYILCDKADYLLGIGAEGAPTGDSLRRFSLSKAQHEKALTGVPGAEPVLAFFRTWKPEEALSNPHLKERFADLASGALMVFRVVGENARVHEKDAVAAAAGCFMEGEAKTDTAFCLVTSEKTQVSQVHSSIKGVRGAQTFGAALVSFNCDAFTSYGKAQSVNAPVSAEAARGYVAALNWLLADPKHRVQLGDATTVFWSEEPAAEPMMAELIGQSLDAGGNGESDETRQKMEDILTRVALGAHIDENLLGFSPETRTYILGLAPNNSRLVVRFWHRDSFGSLVRRVAQHHADMALVRQYESQDQFIPLPRLLTQMAPRGDLDRLPCALTGGLMRAIFTGGLYPEGVFAALIGRIRANDGGTDARGNPLNPVNYARVTLIKAVLARRARILKNTEEECLTMNLNQSADTAYRLGRLFALLEKAQQDANPGINATIRDRYFATASASPVAAFPILLRLSQHHIKKSEFGFAIDRRIQDVMNGIDEFPAHLTLEQQGRFMLGYYHQRQDLYTKKPDNAKGEEGNGEGN